MIFKKKTFRRYSQRRINHKPIRNQGIDKSKLQLEIKIFCNIGYTKKPSNRNQTVSKKKQIGL
jgi:hypothetical protein